MSLQFTTKFDGTKELIKPYICHCGFCTAANGPCLCHHKPKPKFTTRKHCNLHGPYCPDNCKYHELKKVYGSDFNFVPSLKPIIKSKPSKKELDQFRKKNIPKTIKTYHKHLENNITSSADKRRIEKLKRESLREVHENYL